MFAETHLSVGDIEPNSESQQTTPKKERNEI
jgi:hypothetical protein